MKQKDIFNDLILELIEINNNQKIDFKDKFFGSISADNGRSVFLNRNASSLLNNYIKNLYENYSNKNRVDFRTYERISEREIANTITSDRFQTNNIDEAIKSIRTRIDEKFKDVETIKTTHHFPATTFISKFKKSIKIGGISIRSLEQWLHEVDFSPDLFTWYEKNASEDKSWKLEVLEGLKKELEVEEMSDVAKTVYQIIKNNNSMVSVEIKGYEPILSEEFARQICKAALDMISLTLSHQSVFYNNILQLERLPVLNYGEFTENNGYLNLPSSGISKLFVPIFDEEQYDHAYDLINEMLEPYSFIINGILSPEITKYPILTSKWVFALNWYAEGMRESNDAIAVAKLASCLDTLSSSGKYAGIKQVLRNVYNSDDSYCLFGDKDLNPITIHTFVKRFYDDSRSRILHGTIKNMLESFADDRNRLADVARWVLLDLANKLSVYDGDDDEKAFRTMKYNV
ncbi:HEPN domain-containing protein [Acinetobacter nematophilus]|uniref:HEPN domain-containing protein n=1 Tax=Acinetobacter nematophilus TaxID=2994642 RepID=A0A9X3DR38_9GAMM|nr:HEPN domain-containing protein [Acinetobacter nematophilus]MCX5466257.1 HEPN domain-containing protein [Acinetobacter nematophilus]